MIRELLSLPLYETQYTSSFHSQAFIISSLNPWFLTGFADAESSFRIKLQKNNKLKVGWQVGTYFQISVHNKDRVLLESIQSFFDGVGNIYKEHKDSIQYRVNTLKDLKVVIGHFDKYPLITQKYANFELFKQVVDLMNRKEHLTQDGLYEIVSLRAAMNNGLSDELKAAFPGVIAVPRLKVVEQQIKSPDWLAGFTSGEGCFRVDINNSSNKGRVNLRLTITQHNKDEQLLQSFIKYFGLAEGLPTAEKKSKYVYKYSDKDAVKFDVTRYSDLTEKIIPFFDKYPIYGDKAKDFEDFKRVALLMQSKAHLTREGLEQIRKIKSEMNRGRKVWDI